MALAAEAIDDDAGDFEPRVISYAALDDRRRRPHQGLTGDVDDQLGTGMPSAAATSANAPVRPVSPGMPSKRPIEASHTKRKRAVSLHRLPGKRGQKLVAMAQESRLTPSLPGAAA